MALGVALFSGVVKKRLAYLVACLILSVGAEAQQGNLIENVERYLADLGFDPGPRDGQIDTALHQAIAAWQQSTGRSATGGLDGAEYQALEQAWSSKAQIPQSGSATTSLAEPLRAPSASTPSIHHRVESCPNHSGLGLMHYHDGGHDTVQLSDFCFDEATGSVWSSEPLQDLTYVGETVEGRRWELLNGTEDPTLRSYFMVGSGIATMDCGVPETSFDSFTYYPSLLSYSLSQVPEADFLGTEGYFLNGSAAPVTDRPYSLTMMSLIPYYAENAAQELVNANISGLWYEGRLQFEGPIGTFDLVGANVPGVVDGQGQMTFRRLADGSLRASGTLRAANGRVAGHGPGEWTQVRVAINDMVGHVIGENGQVIKGLGIADAVYTTSQGDERALKMTVVLATCAL